MAITNYWVGIYHHDWLEYAYFKDTLNDKSLAGPGSIRELPVVSITHGTPFRVCAMNAVATACAIEPGMNLASAEALAAHLQTRSQNLEKEYDALLERAEYWHELTPEVHVIAPGTVLLNMTSCLQLWHGPEHVMAKINDRLTQLDIQSFVSVCWGFSPLSVQSYFSQLNPLKKFNQKAAAHTMTAPKYFEVTPAAVAQFSINAFPEDQSIRPALTPKALAQFKKNTQQMGLRSIGEIFSIPKAELNTAFSPDVIEYLEKFCGDQPDPQITTPRPKYFAQNILIEPPAQSHKEVAGYFQQAIEKLQPQITLHQLAVAGIIVTMTDDNKQQQQLTIGSRQPVQQLQRLFELFELQLQRVTFTSAIERLHVEISQLVPLEQQNASLWPESVQQAAYTKRLHLLDRLQSRLGDKAVQQITALEHHTPELSWSMNTTTDQAPNPVRLRRPRFVLNPPMAIETRHNLPFYKTPLDPVYGPEVIDILSWLQPEQRRYYIAKCSKNIHYWVYETSDHTWYLQGLFS